MSLSPNFPDVVKNQKVNIEIRCFPDQESRDYSLEVKGHRVALYYQDIFTKDHLKWLLAQVLYLDDICQIRFEDAQYRLEVKTDTVDPDKSRVIVWFKIPTHFTRSLKPAFTKLDFLNYINDYLPTFNSLLHFNLIKDIPRKSFDLEKIPGEMPGETEYFYKKSDPETVKKPDNDIIERLDRIDAMLATINKLLTEKSVKN